MNRRKMDGERGHEESNNSSEKEIFENDSATFSLRTQDNSRDWPVFAQGDFLSSLDKVQAMKKELLLLRELMIKQENSYREDLSRHRKHASALQQSLQQSNEQEMIMKKEMNDCSAENRKFQMVLEEYKQAVTNILGDKDKAQISHLEKKIKIQKDTQTVKDHLINTQKAYEDLKSKYDNMRRLLQKDSKQIIDLNEKFNENKNSIEHISEKYEALKLQAQLELQRANEDLAAMTRIHHNDTSRLSAIIKKSELRIRSLEEIMTQKTRENKALMAMCDDLINDQGKHEHTENVKKYELSDTFPDKCV